MSDQTTVERLLDLIDQYKAGAERRKMPQEVRDVLSELREKAALLAEAERPTPPPDAVTRAKLEQDK